MARTLSFKEAILCLLKGDTGPKFSKAGPLDVFFDDLVIYVSKWDEVYKYRGVPASVLYDEAELLHYLLESFKHLAWNLFENPEQTEYSRKRSRDEIELWFVKMLDLIEHIADNVFRQPGVLAATEPTGKFATLVANGELGSDCTLMLTRALEAVRGQHLPYLEKLLPRLILLFVRFVDAALAAGPDRVFQFQHLHMLYVVGELALSDYYWLKISDMCIQNGRLKRLVQRKLAINVIVEDNPADAFDMFKKLRSTPKAEPSKSIAALLLIHAVQYGLTIRYKLKGGFTSCKDLAWFTHAPAVFQQIGPDCVNVVEKLGPERHVMLPCLFATVRCIGGEYRARMTHCLLDMEVMRSADMPNMAFATKLSLLGNWERTLTAALGAYTVQDWCEDSHENQLLELDPALLQDLTLLSDLTTCVFFNLSRAIGMAISEDEAHEYDIDSTICPILSNLLRLYVSLAVLFKKIDNHEYQAVVASLNIHGTISESIYEALMSPVWFILKINEPAGHSAYKVENALQTMRKTVIAADAFARSGCILGEDLQELMGVLHEASCNFVGRCTGKDFLSTKHVAMRGAISQLADMSLFILRVMKFISCKDDFDYLPSTLPDQFEEEFFPLSNLLLDLDCMMRICQQMTTPNPESFTIPKDHCCPRHDTWEDSVKLRVLNAVKTYLD